MPRDTPIDVFFTMLEEEFLLGRRSASGIILADREVKWGRKMRNARQVALGPGDRRQLTDYVSNSLPGSIPPEALEAPRTSIPQLFDRVVAHLHDDGGFEGPSSALYQRINDTLIKTYYPPMLCALEDYACAADIFDNVLDAVREADFASERHRACVGLALYALAAFLGDVERAGNLTVQFCAATYGIDLLEEWDPALAREHEQVPADLGVQRLVAGDVRGRRHTLDPEGTMFGSLPATDGDYVADVNNSVSYQHLLVYRDDEFRWFARDLGSRWGTTIERPGLDKPLVVALPLDEQVEEPQDVEVLPGDTLVLGSTRFEVQRFQRGE